MEENGNGRVRARPHLLLLVFLLIYIPLDAFDADTSDTFDEGVVEVRVKVGGGGVHSVLHLLAVVPEVPGAATTLHAVASVSEPTRTVIVARKPFNLPRSDDPHVATAPRVTSPAHSFIK